jgi:predicted MPP superfamily phosphohydrolase
MKRRRFIRNGILTLTGLGLAGGFYGWQIEPFWLEFARMKMPVRNLPKELHGKILMQISDLHVGNRFDYTYLIKSLKKAKEFNPDFVVYTGDFVSSDKDKVEYEKLIEVLQSFVKGKYATVAILGNHDYGRNWSQEKVAERVSQLLTENGVSLLRNGQQEFAGLNFIGLDDYWV